MRVFSAILSFVLTVGIVYLLNGPIGAALPALGPLLDPVNGCWTSAESVHKNFNNSLKLSGLKDPVAVWYDERMVAHIHAQNDHDLYMVQGYIHAYFRLWQMDLQTRAAAGRVSEILGEKALAFDRTQRRKGMVFAAENSLHAMEQEPRTKTMLDAYTEGINTYIATLSYHEYPLEYKLMGFEPEKWTNLKTALMLKYMADDLTGKTDDIAMSILKNTLSYEEIDKLFPDHIAGSATVIPKGTILEQPSLKVPQLPSAPDSLFPKIVGTVAANYTVSESGIGSNNWALNGVRTRSGATILCNDPHLGLNLPSLWFEMQMQAPGLNVYGVSLPGAPGIIIGFNDSLSWGMTNNYRDVKDFYLLRSDGNGYWLDGKQLQFKQRIEKIGIKDKDTFSEVVNYSVHGPVMYDERFPYSKDLKMPLAMCWMAHKGTNELMAVYLLNRAKSYTDFTDAIQYFQCPAQNFIYADRSGNIALWGQGQFINKWKDQGKFIMDGSTSKTLWGENIPMQENPHVVNPLQGYLASANQSVTDTSYPYWYNGNFVELRAWRINQLLDSMHSATVEDMFRMQNDVYSVLAAHMVPAMLKYAPVTSTADEKGYIDALTNWNYNLSAESKAASCFQVWWYYLNKELWDSECKELITPLQERTMQFFTDSSFAVNAKPAIQNSFKKCMDSLKKCKNAEWYMVKNTTVKHLTKLPAFSYPNIKIGGWGNVINAANSDHGPSWRMVVQMGKDIEAYGIYPGGQSGNPGSPYYGNSIDAWTNGKYYRLLFLPNEAKQNNSQIKFTWTIEP